MAGVELYFYWRVGDGRLDAAGAALLHWHAGLMARHPGLQARLLRRTDARGITVMETYAAPAGIGADLRAELSEQGALVVAPHAAGDRKLEAFEPLEQLEP